ncbi:MAG: peptidase S11, partial [Polaromonas sp.]|nr:peptidase S11 [Polaromonas sp.]
MPNTLNLIFTRSLQLVGFLTVSVALIFPAASEAAPAKRQVVKKSHATKTVSKKVVSSRKSARFVAKTQRKPIIVATPARPSYGQIAGLHGAQDPLDLKSSVALVI